MDQEGVAIAIPLLVTTLMLRGICYGQVYFKISLIY